MKSYEEEMKCDFVLQIEKKTAERIQMSFVPLFLSGF